MRQKLSTLLILLILIQNTPNLQAQTRNKFYVSPTGNNSNNGSIESPWNTIEHGINQIGTGDILYIREGIYYEKLYLETSGAPQNYICIRNYPGEKPIIDGSDSYGNGFVITSSHFKLIGLELRNWDENAIWIEASQYFEVINCTVTNVLCGIAVADGSNNFLIKDCIMTEFTLYGFDASPVTERDCYNALIQDCTAHSATDHDQNVDGFAVGHGDQKGFTLVNCTTYDVFDGFDISSDDTLLIGCLSYSCWNAGYKMWGDNITLINCIDYASNNNIELDWSGTPKTISVYHSDFVNSQTFSVWIENHLDKIRIYNSVILGGENIALCFENGFSDSYEGDYNLIHNSNPNRAISIEYEEEYSLTDLSNLKWSQKTGQDQHSIVTTEINGIFMDIDNMNLYPESGSLLINNGDPSRSISYDYAYNKRDDKPDIGALESNPTGNTINKPLIKIPQTISEDQSNVNETPIDYEGNNKLYLAVVLAISVIMVSLYLRQKMLYK
jgi:hypothetical protein